MKLEKKDTTTKMKLNENNEQVQKKKERMNE